jgi:hypothetical protein
MASVDPPPHFLIGKRSRKEPSLTWFQDWVIPLTKEVEIDYLLQRLSGEPAFLKMA